MDRTIVGASLALAALAAPCVSAGELTLPVVEDTWIQGLDGAAVQGNNVQLGICPSANYWIYLKFDLSAVPCPIADAELRLVRVSGTNPSEISLYEVFDDGWSEATLNGPNRPTPTNPPSGTGLAAGEALVLFDRWSSPALTELAGQEAGGDGVVSLMLREDPLPMIDIRFYRSQEAAVPDADKPRLVLTLGPHGADQVVLDDGAGPTSLSWQSTGATGFDLASGLLADLHADGGVAGASCLADDLPVATFDDSNPDPPPGTGRYYLVRAQDGCGTGSWGFDSMSQERLPAAACP
jgi:hypothetical protein